MNKSKFKFLMYCFFVVYITASIVSFMMDAMTDYKVAEQEKAVVEETEKDK